MVIKVQLVIKVIWEPKDLMVNKVQLEIGALKDIKVKLDHMEKKDTKEIQEIRALKDLKDILVSKVILVPKVKLEIKVLLVTEEKKE